VDKKISEKQKKFCDYYLESGNATEAYIKAGYNTKGARHNASRMITNDNIKAYIEERTRQMDSERIATPEEVLKYFTSVMRGEIKDQFDLDAPLTERTKAADALAKRFKFYDKDSRTLTEIEKEKERLEIEYKRLQNKKLEAEIKTITGDNNEITANDGFIKALNSTAQEDWEDEKEDN
jgi:phage terminase small subunit